MSVNLSVRQVRDEIAKAAGALNPVAAPSSSRLIGTMFHEIAGELFGHDPVFHFRAALGEAPGESSPDRQSWARAIRDHLYRRSLGPRIQANHAAFQTAPAELLTLWRGVAALSAWTADLAAAALDHSNAPGADWAPDLFPAISVEESLAWELREPGWTEAVTISGVADAIFRLPSVNTWCVVEFKTGQRSPEADLAQACLYYQMLAAREPSEGAVALVYFTPQLAQRVFSAADLRPAEQRLKALIGRLAGVVPAAGPPPLSAQPLPPPPPMAQTTPVPAPPLVKPVIPPAASSEHAELGRKMLAAFREYSTPVEMAGEVVAGPAFLRFPVRPARGVRPEAVQKQDVALQVRLGLKQVPFVHRHEGRLVVDLERPDRQTLTFAAIRDQIVPGEAHRGGSRVVVGAGLGGDLKFADLAQSENCHILVAGTTGSGKTEWLRTAIASLILANTNETIRFVLIDPKRSAFNDLNGSPYVWGDRRILYPDETNPVETLDALGDEMEHRYRVFQQAGVDNLLEYHLAGGPLALPRIVCVCEEYADLLNYGRKEIERCIQRLGQKARGAGIHLILAVQQPSREIVKGAIQANIPARVGLRLASPIESKMLLDRPGAEQLLGYGDLLFKDIGEPVRLQAPYLPAADRQAIFTAGRGE